MFAEFVSRYPTIKIIYVLSIRIHGFHVQALPFILSFLRKKRTYCLFLNPFGIYSIKCVHTLLHVYCLTLSKQSKLIKLLLSLGYISLY